MEADAVEAVLRRFEAIGRSLRESGQALALLALGSGAEPSRIDRWSDLDFFAVVKPGSKQALLKDLRWLAAAHPLAWAYRNTVDGWKALFADGLFAEFALFEPQELEAIPFAPGRIVWKAEDFEATLLTPAPRHFPPPSDPQWLLGEALSNLFVGLGRWHRGEKMEGFRLIQGHAVQAVLKLVAQSEPAAPGVAADVFAPERRVESRYPELMEELHCFLQGVDRCPEAAEALLEFLERRYDVPSALRQAVRARLVAH